MHFTKHACVCVGGGFLSLCLSVWLSLSVSLSLCVCLSILCLSSVCLCVWQIAYVQQWMVFDIANYTFGFNGWSRSIRAINIDYADKRGSKFEVGVSAIIRVTLKVSEPVRASATYNTPHSTHPTQHDKLLGWSIPRGHWVWQCHYAHKASR